MDTVTLKIEQYEGPLDLLLSLITKSKIDIFDIPIAEIARQYMEYIDNMRRFNMDIASEFIYMASELMLIKSKMLLPKAEDTPDPRKELVDALLEYSRAKNTAAYLKSQSELYFDRFTKEPDDGDPTYTRTHSVTLLLEALRTLEARINKIQEPPVALFEKIQNERNYTIEEKTLFIKASLAKTRVSHFIRLFDGCESRNEIIATFLALLDLIRTSEITVEKKNNNIIIRLCSNIS